LFCKNKTTKISGVSRKEGIRGGHLRTKALEGYYMTSLHLETTFKNQNVHYGILRNGNKHLSKTKQIVFSLKTCRHQL